jgi:cytochrome b6-f complex iron-sulfur subunit
MALQMSTGGNSSKFSRTSTTLMAESPASNYEPPTMVPDMAKRTLMNWLLVGASSGPILGMGFPYILFFVPRSKGSGSAGVDALDRNGDVVKLTAWKSNHKENDRALVQGLKGDATYLVSTSDGVKDFGINAVCTHLGCVVPWN